MQPALRSQNSQQAGRRGQLAWKGLAEHVLADAGVEEVDGLVYVPYRGEHGRIMFCKVFGHARSWYSPGGIDLVPYGVDRLPVSRWIAARSALLICEGESDTLAARECFVEGNSKVLAWYAVGLPGSGTWRRSWRQWLAPFPRIYLCGDGDDPGRRLNELVWKDVPWARPVWLPDGEDIRSILQRDGRNGLLPHLAAADADARLTAALALAPDLATFERLLREDEQQ